MGKGKCLPAKALKGMQDLRMCARVLLHVVPVRTDVAACVEGTREPDVQQTEQSCHHLDRSWIRCGGHW